MFERDKDDLRELGLVIETVENLDGEIGYLARRDRNRLPEITLDAEEAAALSLAAKVWQQARLAGAASGALQKLRAAGVPFGRPRTPPTAHSALEPRIPAHEAGLRAADARRPGPPPGVVRLPQGQRGAPRAARGRAVGAGVLARPLVPGRLGPGPRGRAGLPAHPDQRPGPLARRTPSPRRCPTTWTCGRPWRAGPGRARPPPPGSGCAAAPATRCAPGRSRPSRSDAEWDELEIPYGHGLDAWLVEFGPDVVVVEPAELRADVVGPAACRGRRLLRGRPTPCRERDRPDPPDALPGDLSARAARRPGQRGGPGLRGHRGRADRRPQRAADVRDQLPRRRPAGHRHRRRADLVAQPAPPTTWRSRCGWPPTRPPRCWWRPARWPTLPGLRDSDRQALLRACAKLETAAGEAAGASARLSVTFESEGSVFADVDRAITERRRLWIRYYSPARDELTEREVDPIRLFAVGHTYFEALVPAVGGPPDVPAGPGRRDQAARRTRRPAQDRAARPVRRAGAARRATTPRWSSRSAPAGAGSPSTTRTTAPRSCRTAGCGSRCAPPTPVRCAGSALRLGRDGRIVAPQELADSARKAAAEALAAYGEL